MKHKKKLSDFSKNIATSSFAAIISVLVSSLTYTTINRTVNDFLKYSLYISGASIALVVVIIAIFYFKSKPLKTTKGDKFFTILLLVVLGLTGPIYYSTTVAFKDLYLWLQSPEISKSWAIVFVLVLTIILGFSLFFFRLYARSIYGVTELLVGLGVAVQKISSQESVEITKSSFYLVILTASVYLFVRGLDNIHQGLTKEPLDPYAKKIYLFLFKGKTSIIDDTAANSGFTQ